MELIYKLYNGMKAKLGDVVYARRDKDKDTAPPPPPQTVVYVGKDAFVVESSGGILTTYKKDSAGMHIFSAERMLVVNGFEVPAPLEKDPGEGHVVYVADPTLSEWYGALIHTQIGRALRPRMIARGLAHDTAAAAIAHAKAMVGVDPTTRKSLDDAYDELP